MSNCNFAEKRSEKLKEHAWRTEPSFHTPLRILEEEKNLYYICVFKPLRPHTLCVFKPFCSHVHIVYVYLSTSEKIPKHHLKLRGAPQCNFWAKTGKDHNTYFPLPNSGNWRHIFSEFFFVLVFLCVSRNTNSNCMAG